MTGSGQRPAGNAATAVAGDVVRGELTQPLCRVARCALPAALVIAAVLRLAWLGEIPAGLSHDEAVKGYDAWSIFHTGRDQYGERYPLVFRAIGDQREALLPYLVVLSEVALGPTDLAVRLPTALAGIALVGALFLLTRELYGSRVALIAALLLAISPWHIQVSRLAFRAGLLPLTTVTGLWLLLVARRRPALLLPAGLVLGLGLHTYLAARLFLPLLLLGVLVIERRWLFSRVPGSKFKVPSGPTWNFELGTWNWVRLLAGVAVIAMPLVVWGATHPAEFAGHAAESAESGGLLRQALDAAGRYAVYVGHQHLLTQGDPYPVPSTGRLGAVYWPLLPFLAAGVLRMVTRRSRADQIVLWWLLIYPIPAALTRGSHPDWLRATCGISVLEVVSAVGLVGTADWAARRYSRRVVALCVACVAGLVALNAAWFLSDYALRFPDRTAPAFNDGIAAAVRELASREDGHRRVVLPADVAAVHDFYLFYARYDPPRLHAEGLEDAAGPGGWAEVRGFGRHRVCDPVVCCGPGDICLARAPWLGGGTVLREVRDRTGRVAFVVVVGE